ncbi:histidine kinase/DNA gyrase B/HSP90-like ATPase [Natranaerovirga pectinivora]|uniref:Histidine kinase/DNA gyrase B/HSP90-like ATPase n=1 Tax=Natranaerovirga pectinivora TaxID=682400 RepID=A0A4V2V0A7_9FIRM|nr:ATP-binding protein [Natranaerovirga pectinivora]TCT14981.1 histidine kinase/DNA gyrase B/HSP90-like ATPase [Natranaerovirga pectinivora]
MKEISMHITDIVSNSVRAKANNITVEVVEDLINNLLKVIIMDDGIGIDDELILTIKDPFVTSRTLRKIGLGIPLFDQTCNQCNGNLVIQSKKNQGTKITASMAYNHIDRPPLGDLPTSIAGIIISMDKSNFSYRHLYNNKKFEITSKEIYEILGNELSINNPKIYLWLKEYIKENISELYNI